MNTRSFRTLDVGSGKCSESRNVGINRHVRGRWSKLPGPTSSSRIGDWHFIRPTTIAQNVILESHKTSITPIATAIDKVIPRNTCPFLRAQSAPPRPRPKQYSAPTQFPHSTAAQRNITHNILLPPNYDRNTQLHQAPIETRDEIHMHRSHHHNSGSIMDVDAHARDGRSGFPRAQGMEFPHKSGISRRTRSRSTQRE